MADSPRGFQDQLYDSMEHKGAVVTPSQIILLDRNTAAKQASIAVGGDANAVAISSEHALVATFSLMALEVQVWRLEVAARKESFFSIGSSTAKSALKAQHELSCKVQLELTRVRIQNT